MALGITQDKVQLEIELNGRQVKNTINGLTKEYKKLNRDIRKLTPGTEEFLQKSRELATIKQSLNDARDAAKAFDQRLTFGQKAAKGLGKALKAALAPLVGLFAVGELLNFITSMGAAEAKFNRLRATLNRGSAAIGEDFALVGEELDKVAANVVALERTFNQSQEKIIGAAQAAAAAYGQSYGDAIAEIEKGLLLVGEAGGEELLTQIDEYSVQFAQAGFELEDTVAVIAQGINQGIFTDKAADAVKEFGLRITDLSKTQEDILRQNFGELYVKQLKQGLADGSVEVIDVLDDVATKVDQIEQKGGNAQPLVANLFGAAGEDAGRQFIRTLVGVSEGLDTVIDTGNMYVDQQLQQLQANKALAQSQAEFTARFEGATTVLGTYVARAQAFLLNVAVDLIDFFTTLPERIDILGVRFRIFVSEGIKQLNKLIDFLLGGLRPILEKTFDIELQIDTTATEVLDQELAQAQDAVGDKLAERAQHREEAQQFRALQAQQAGQRKREEQETQFLEQQAKEELRIREEAARQIEDLRLALLPDSLEKELAILETQTARRIEAQKGTEEQVAIQRALLLEQQAQQEEQIREKYRLKEEETERQRQQEKLTEREEAFREQLRQLEEQQEALALRATQQAVSDIQAGDDPAVVEQRLKDQLLDQESRFFDQKLALLRAFGMDTTTTEQAIADQRLGITRQRVEQEIAEEQRLRDERQRLVEDTLGNIRTFSGLAFEALAAQNEASVNRLEEARQRELKSAGESSEKRKAIEEKYQKQIDALDKKRREQEKARAIVESIIQTALNVTKVLANPVQAVAVGIAGAIQTAIIAKQQFAEGGHTGPGIMAPDSTGQRPAGVVHEREWVAPRWMTESPTYRPTIQALESARLRGYATGGMVGANIPSATAVAAPSLPNAADMTRQMEEALGRALAANPLVALIDEQAADTVTRKQSDINRRRSKNRFT